MMRSLLTLAASALLLAGSMGLAQAQTTGSDTEQQGQDVMQQGQQGEPMMQSKERKNYRRHDRRSGMRHHGMGMMGHGMMGQGMMGHGMMGHGMMGHGMGHGAVMHVLFALLDADGNGSLSLTEVQDGHARIFAHMDADDDDQVTKDEIKAFFRGGKERRGGRRDRPEDTDDSAMPDDMPEDTDDADEESGDAE